MLLSLKESVAAILPEIVALRHELHQHPEIRFEEHWTADRIAAFLDAHGIPCSRGHARGTGIVATLRGAAETPIVALRADMDALQIQEETGLPYASCIPRRMHACGHDGHMAVLCGVAQVLAAHRSQLPGSVKLMFQPAEEQAGGGRLMVEEGLLDGVSAAFALHGWPAVPLHKAAISDRQVMASADFFTIRVEGRGGHGADPGKTIDPIVAAAHIITALQTVAARETDPWDAAVVTVSHIEAGATSNIIPDSAFMQGTFRALTLETRDRIARAIERIVAQTAQAHRAIASVSLGHDAYPPLINDPDMAALARDAARDVLGAEGVVAPAHPYMTAEDFAFFLHEVPGVYLLLGLGGPEALHTARFDFNDAVLPNAIELMANIALRALRHFRAD